MTAEKMNNALSVTEDSLQRLDETVDGLVTENEFRGGSMLAAAEISALDRRQKQMRLLHPFSYTFTDVLDGPEGHRYRSGREGGQAVFTVDDCVALFEERYAARRGVWGGACAVEKSEAYACMNTAERPAAAYCCGDAVTARSPFGRSAVVFANGSAGMTVKTNNRGENRLVAFFKKYLEAPTVLSAKMPWKRTSEAIAALSLILVFTVLLALPVVMKILIHQEAGVISGLDKQIRTAEAEMSQLEIELNQKNDRVLLERIAVEEYHMVRLDHSNYSILCLNPEDAAETVEKEKSGGAVPALLKALGLRTDD